MKIVFRLPADSGLSGRSEKAILPRKPNFSLGSLGGTVIAILSDEVEYCVRGVENLKQLHEVIRIATMAIERVILVQLRTPIVF